MGTKPLLSMALSLSRGTVLLMSLLTVRWNDRGEAARRLAPGMDALGQPLHLYMYVTLSLLELQSSWIVTITKPRPSAATVIEEWGLRPRL